MAVLAVWTGARGGSGGGAGGWPAASLERNGSVHVVCGGTSRTQEPVWFQCVWGNKTLTLHARARDSLQRSRTRR